MSRRHLIGQWIDKDTWEPPPWLGYPIGLAALAVIVGLWLLWLLAEGTIIIGSIILLLRMIVQAIIG